MIQVGKELAYLLGLICGRGHILQKDKKIIIEFAHKNKTAYGIAYCKKCGELATAQKTDDKEEKELICKICKSKVPFSVKRVYEQRESTIGSIKKEIIPFLSTKLNVDYDIIGNDHMTLLVLDFNKDKSNFKDLIKFFKSKTSFDSFEIPKELSSSKKESKIEFINGLMDTAGFFNTGSWMPRSGEKGYGVMRGYFQIVRNWKMPVQICDFLNTEFSLNIQTIDWGHPNMRDQANIYAWAREHQVKFFPEDYRIFSPKIRHKKEMFLELVQHNKKIKFDGKDIFGIAPIDNGQIKPYHPEENNTKLPIEIKGIHFDASWQIALKLGSNYIKNQFNTAKYKEILYLTGKDEDLDYSEELKKVEGIRNKKTKEVESEREKVEEEISKREEKRIRTNPEQRLYLPLCEYLGNHFSKLYKEKIKFYDTSSFYLNKFISESNVSEEFEYYEEFKIKPDLVGFVISSKKILIAEIKATELSLRDLGQLRGYCLIANPEYAILISNKKPSLNLKKILKMNKDILNYFGKTIKIGFWNGKEVSLIEI
ncbi:MAG: hypothetical protein V1886_02530 [archaeon]